MGLKGLYVKYAEKYPRLYEIFKFLLVGGLATLIDMAVMAVVLYLAAPASYEYNFIKVVFRGAVQPAVWAAVLGTALGFIFGLIVNYSLSVLFVFKNGKKAKNVRGFILFTLFALGGLTIHVVCTHLAGEFIGFNTLNEWAVKIVLTAVVLAYNYIMRKLFVFNADKPKTETADGGAADGGAADGGAAKIS